MYDTTDIRKGLKIELDGDPFQVIEFQFVKPGKGNAFTRCKIKNMITGAVLDRTYRSGEKLKKAELEEHTMQFLYKDESGFNLMNQSTYDQVAIPEETIGDDSRFLTENLNVDVLFFHGQAIGVTLPNFVEMTVTDTEPGVKGDTVSGARKQATMETGTIINVPLFIERGEKLRIDTRSGDYVERVKG